MVNQKREYCEITFNIFRRYVRGILERQTPKVGGRQKEAFVVPQERTKEP